MAGGVFTPQTHYYLHSKPHRNRFHLTNTVLFAFQASQDSLPPDNYRTFRFSSLTGFASTRQIQEFSHCGPYKNRFDSTNTIYFAGPASQELLSLDERNAFRVLRFTGLASTWQIQQFSHFKAHRNRFHSTTTVHLAFQGLLLRNITINMCLLALTLQLPLTFSFYTREGVYQ